MLPGYKIPGTGVGIAQSSVHASHPANPGLILGVPKIFSDENSNFLIVDQTHLVQASGKLVLQKRYQEPKSHYLDCELLNGLKYVFG